MERIVVAVDGSDGAVAAVALAAALAAPMGAEVVAVHAVGLLERLADGTTVPSIEVRGEPLDQLVRKWCRPLDDAGIRWRAALRDGDAIDVITDVADAEAADLVVIGSRRLGSMSPLLLGSTSTAVAQALDRPVVLVPPGWRAPA